VIIILVPFDNSSVKEGATKSPNKQERRGDTRKERLKPQISNNDESTGGRSDQIPNSVRTTKRHEEGATVISNKQERPRKHEERTDHLLIWKERGRKDYC
jgi:hypothetical protein